MNENQSSKKKDIIKNVIIVFLILMLLLTLFSNTFRNYSLPEVTMVNPASGVIKEQARGTAQLEAGETYLVNATETRTISSVAVKKGDHVEIGDPLFYMEDVDSDEYLKAKEEYEKAKNEYLKALLSQDISADSIVKARSGNFDTAATWQAKLQKVESEIEEKEAIYQDYLNRAAASNIENAYQTYIETNWSEQVIKAELEAELAQLENKDVQMAFTIEKAKKSADLQYQMDKFLTKNSVTKASDLPTEELRDEYERMVEDKAKLEATIYENEADIIAVAQKLAAVTRSVAASEGKAKVEAAKTKAYNEPDRLYYENIKADIDALKAERESYIKDMTAQVVVEGYSDVLSSKQEAMEKAKAKCTGATINAEVAGTISTIDKVAGEKMEKDKQIASIIPDGKGYTLNISVDNKQAERVKVGDAGELANQWKHEDAVLIVKSIKEDPDNAGKKKIISFSVEGSDLTIGESLTVSVGAKSQTYDLTIPNAAFKKDANGGFVLILTEKKTPFGKRYIASRVDAKEKASDDTNTAITATITSSDYVIVSSTKPLKDGEEFRLKEE